MSARRIPIQVHEGISAAGAELRGSNAADRWWVFRRKQPLRRQKPAFWSAVVALLLGTGTASVSAQTHVRCHGDIETLCRQSAVAPATVVPNAAPGAYVAARHARLLDIYTVDVDSTQLALSGYDADTELGSVTIPAHVAVEEGGRVTLDVTSFTFRATPGQWRALEQQLRSSKARLRVFFALSALFEPDAAYCPDEPARAHALMGRALAADLLMHGQESAAPARSLTATATEAKVFFGPEPLSNTQPRRRPTVRLKRAPGVADDPTEALERHLEGHLLTCFLKSLHKGGPSSAALVIDANLDDGGNVAVGTVAVDATGFPPLAACARTEPPPAAPDTRKTAGAKVRFTAFFEFK